MLVQSTSRYFHMEYGAFMLFCLIRVSMVTWLKHFWERWNIKPSVPQYLGLSVFKWHNRQEREPANRAGNLLLLSPRTSGCFSYSRVHCGPSFCFLLLVQGIIDFNQDVWAPHYLDTAKQLIAGIFTLSKMDINIIQSGLRVHLAHSSGVKAIFLRMYSA